MKEEENLTIFTAYHAEVLMNRKNYNILVWAVLYCLAVIASTLIELFVCANDSQ